MKRLSSYRGFCAPLIRDESGAALVEFAILLPMLLLVFAMIIEGGRLMWSYQSVNAGVRDAARYLARVAPANICSGGTAISTYTAKLTEIVEDTLDGNSIFPPGITINSVTPSLTCAAGTFRVSPAPVAQVQVEMTITFPFAGLFSLNGQSLSTLTKTVRDQSKVYGT